MKNYIDKSTIFYFFKLTYLFFRLVYMFDKGIKNERNIIINQVSIDLCD